jgi:hypothetical protein
MAITFHFRPEENLVICVHQGDRPDDEFLAACKGMYENDLFSVSMNRLIDMRQSLSDSRSASALRQMAEFVNTQFAETDAHPKIAIIAPADLAFGLCRMYEGFADTVPWDLVVFRAVDAALAWLRLPEDYMDNFDNDTHQNAP